MTNKPDLLPEENKKPLSMYGFAEGHYSCICIECKLGFDWAAKRSIRCKSCAEYLQKKAMEDAAQREPADVENSLSGTSSTTPDTISVKRTELETAIRKLKISHEMTSGFITKHGIEECLSILTRALKTHDERE